MCGCFVIGLGAFFPRVALVLIWIFSNWIEKAFDSNWVVPLLGILLLPYTTLAYVLINLWWGPVSGFEWFFVVLAFFIDLGSYAGGARARSAQVA